MNVLVLAYLDHLGREDTGGTIKRGKGLSQLGHVSPQRWRFLHEIDLIAAVGYIQGGLDAGDAAPDHEHPFGYGALEGLQRFCIEQPAQAAFDDGKGLFCAFRPIYMYPATVLPYVGHI